MISAPLKNTRHEKFAQSLSEGRTQADAYKEAGFTPDDSNASKLAGQPEVSARVSYLLEEASRFGDVRRTRIVTDLDAIARADISDYYEVVDGAMKLRDITKLPKHLSCAIASVKTKPNGEVELKLKDGLAAQTTLLRYLGGLPEAPSTPTFNIFNVLSADDQRALADALETASGASSDARGAAPHERGED